MSKFTEDQIQEFQETFALFDNRGDGKISGHDLGNVLRALGLNPTEAEVRKCLRGEPDERLSFEAFLPIFSTINKNRDTSTPEDFIEGFKVFDKEQNGFIHAAELRHLLTSLGERLTDEEVEALIQGFEDPHGNINYEEFVKAILVQ